MLSDKELKKKYLPVFWKDPDKYYPTKTLKESGFYRNFCKKCKRPFWNVDSKRNLCGDPGCSPDESFGFIGKSPAKNKLSYEDVWVKFSKMFKGFGYEVIKRYCTVARWNPTMEYTNASIAAFQPYVVSGEIDPPAKKLVIPQFCFRTVDIDNVGFSGSHCVVFNMVGQHAFLPREEWDQNKFFGDIYEWLIKGLGLDKKELTFHEDSWAGGGNLGCCMEFFSRGCELGNQVYMLYEQTPSGVKDLKLKVLDMGMGMERNAWFSQGTNTIYDATFPQVLKRLFEITGVKYDKNIIKRYVPYAGLLNIDEVDDIEKAWKTVAKKIGTTVENLKKNVLPLAGIYSVAEHTRALLILLSDGALPSNTGGGYNLRVILRRALGFIDKYKWNIDLAEICRWHAKELKNLFPELSVNLNDVEEIIRFEVSKYKNTKANTLNILQRLKGKKIDEKELFKLYDTQGITPELVKEEGGKIGIKVDIPDDFYSNVSELHEKQVQVHATKKEVELDLSNIPETKSLYFEDYEKTEFKAKIIKQIGKYLILDNTYFYPTSGGQLHDTGTIAGEKIVDVFKHGKHIVHVLKDEHKFVDGEEVECKIDYDRRIQLAQHHTATHIINAAARRVLGNHVNQASAFKDFDKARIDITHYKALSDEETKKIENEANKIVSEKINTILRFMPKSEAEATYGMTIYQGGVAPGKILRIVEIPEIDVEACGGTHLKNTFEAGKIKILKSTKISDSIVRIEFVAGKAAMESEEKESGDLNEVAKLLNVDKKLVPARARELFEIWKDVVKKGKDRKLEFKSNDEENLRDNELLELTASILKTQPEHVAKTIARFLKEIKDKIS